VPSVTANHVICVSFAHIGDPACPRSIDRGKKFILRGTLKPRFLAGFRTVRIRAYRYADGAWKYYQAYPAINVDYSGYTRYTAKIAVPRTGKFRFKARIDDMMWRPTISSGFSRTLRVR
jgi:hypothetical protein